MPTYSFQCPVCDAKKVIVRPMSDDAAVLCDVDAFAMERDWQADFGKQHFGDLYPYPSVALGVHPDQVAERMRFDKEAGVPTVYNGDGDPIMRNKKHRREFCRAHDVHDRNGGFSDPVPD